MLRPVGSGLPLGFFSFGIGMLLLALLSTMGKPFFSLLLGLACPRMVLSGLYEVGAGKGVYRVSGWIGLALAALAMYGRAALGLEDAKRLDVLPLFRRRDAAASLRATYDEHLERLESEPGVRPQL